MSNSAHPSKRHRSRAATARESLLLVATAIGLAVLVQAFLVKPYRIPSESMLPTLVKHQRVLVNRLGDRFGDPHVGDVVVFHPPVGAEQQLCGDLQRSPLQACDRPNPHQASENFVKRVVAGPGDTIAIRAGHVYRNGRREADGFTRPCGRGSGCDFPNTIRVPPGHFFMMGDNRGRSDDSRYWGPVPREWIVGKVFATYWPIDRIGVL